MRVDRPTRKSFIILRTMQKPIRLRATSPLTESPAPFFLACAPQRRLHVLVAGFVNVESANYITSLNYLASFSIPMNAVFVTPYGYFLNS